MLRANVRRQCQGDAATSCNLLRVRDGCNDADEFAQQTAGLVLETTCVGTGSGMRKRSIDKNNDAVISEIFDLAFGF